MIRCYAKLIGRFGNQMFIYAYTRALCEQNGYELITDRWVGEDIFDIKPTRRFRCEDCEMSTQGYFQDQKSLIYTRQQVKKWFQLSPAILEVADYRRRPFNDMLAHRRVGDYPGYGFVVVSKLSYYAAQVKFGFDPDKFDWITEEKPTVWPELGDDKSFVPDFVRMMRAKVLFRGNSSFSWWAATLGEARVFSPVIKGLVGGREQDCEFVEGNHPQNFEADFLTDLHLKES